jgi:hypothetical protein
LVGVCDRNPGGCESQTPVCDANPQDLNQKLEDSIAILKI